MRTIVVPLDGSEFAESAIVVASRVAVEAEGSIRLVRVSPVGVVEADDRYLTEVASTIDGVDVSTAIVVLEPGQQVASAILQGVEDAGPEATLCMTAHGRGGLGAAVLGSTTEDLLRKTDRPVLVVGRHCSGRWPGQRRLLVPLDGSEQATHVLPEVAGLATDWGLETWLVQIIHAFDTETAQHLDTVLTSAQNRLRDLGVEAKTDYSSVRTRRRRSPSRPACWEPR